MIIAFHKDLWSRKTEKERVKWEELEATDFMLFQN